MVPSRAAERLSPPTLTGMTVEEWADLDEDEPGELVDFQLVEEEVPTNLHEAVVAWLMRVLGAWAVARDGWVFGSEHKLGLGAGRGRKPDVSMYLPGARLSAKASLSKRPPAVVVEVVSPRPRDVHRDRIDKLADYASFGVPFYWLVDPQTRLFEILELGAEGRYAIARAASGGLVEAPGCDGLTLDLDALWTEVDRLSDEDQDEDEAEPQS
jgi:Uma2 family endonuclease